MTALQSDNPHLSSGEVLEGLGITGTVVDNFIGIAIHDPTAFNGRLSETVRQYPEGDIASCMVEGMLLLALTSDAPVKPGDPVYYSQTRGCCRPRFYYSGKLQQSTLVTIPGAMFASYAPASGLARVYLSGRVMGR